MKKIDKVVSYLKTGKMLSFSHAKHRMRISEAYLNRIIYILRNDRHMPIVTWPNAHGNRSYFLAK